MCKLTKTKNDGMACGYKVVAKKDGKYYSLAMGFCYNDHKSIPTVTEQKRISTQFTDDILQVNSYAFEANMVGRTAIFGYLRDAIDIYKEACMYSKETYSVVIVRARIYDDLMSGEYGLSKVVGGKRIEFDDEIPASVF